MLCRQIDILRGIVAADQVYEDEDECGGAEVDALHDPPQPPPEILLVGAAGRRPRGVARTVRDHVRGLGPAHLSSK